MDVNGLLADIDDVDRVAPFRQWARDLYELRQRDALKDDPLFLYCKPPGGPRQFQLPHGVQFIQEQSRERNLGDDRRRESQLAFHLSGRAATRMTRLRSILAIPNITAVPSRNGKAIRWSSTR